MRQQVGKCGDQFASRPLKTPADLLRPRLAIAPERPVECFMPTILACIDRSAYASSVCDHAAWLAAGIEAEVRILHVEQADAGALASPRPPERMDAHVAAAVQRLREDGVARVEGQVVAGGFVDVAVAQGADIIVMGKRGSGSEGDPGGLGSQVEGMIRATETSLCFTSKVHLPVHRALALLDADLSHRRSIEVMRAHPGLRDLESDLVVIADPEIAAPKLAWARANLPSSNDEAFALPARDIARGLASYMGNHRVDLILISRPVLFSEPSLSLRRMEAEGLWAWRTPVIVC
jgi:nucleotide-binding universal stress UspA family protein